MGHGPHPRNPQARYLVIRRETLRVEAMPTPKNGGLTTHLDAMVVMVEVALESPMVNRTCFSLSLPVSNARRMKAQAWFSGSCSMSSNVNTPRWQSPRLSRVRTSSPTLPHFQSMTVYRNTSRKPGRPNRYVTTSIPNLQSSLVWFASNLRSTSLDFNSLPAMQRRMRFV